MNTMIHKPVEREAQRIQANHEELLERVSRVIREDGAIQPFSGLHLARASKPSGRCMGFPRHPCA
ncbi:hypothetical protein KSB_55330 [Ktedonobacter robiniae]|uniref:Uncharacterized protein n=1 Tax=Ktedonobacter robiniae TaxID=2778365 RepID=A0ABQ3UWB4_9CHLR|nr:hypothetical protein [Ktedonobacter robiniae]GHO57058.1 hypothetical protein KSB_55330 [Ktedonobacter robiniae]